MKATVTYTDETVSEFSCDDAYFSKELKCFIMEDGENQLILPLSNIFLITTSKPSWAVKK